MKRWEQAEHDRDDSNEDEGGQKAQAERHDEPSKGAQCHKRFSLARRSIPAAEPSLKIVRENPDSTGRSK